MSFSIFFLFFFNFQNRYKNTNMNKNGYHSDFDILYRINDTTTGLDNRYNESPEILEKQEKQLKKINRFFKLLKTLQDIHIANESKLQLIEEHDIFEKDYEVHIVPKSYLFFYDI